MIKNWNRKYKINDRYFSRWSHNMSYILGLWFADGYINLGEEKKFGPVFDITLHKDDKYLLEKISEILKSNYPLRQNENCFRFTVRSWEIVRDIIRLGGKPNKSLDVSYPKIPEKYFPDFVRGYFDGDGSIFKDSRTKSSYRSCFSSGSKNFLIGLQKDLQKYIPNISSKLKKQHIKNKTYFLLKLNVNSTRRLGTFMYNNDFLRIERKYIRCVANGKVRMPDQDKKRDLFLPFSSARSFIRKQKLRSQTVWWQYCKTKRPSFIPSSPHKTYKNDGWKNWYNWLGYVA